MHLHQSECILLNNACQCICLNFTASHVILLCNLIGLKLFYILSRNFCACFSRVLLPLITILNHPSQKKIHLVTTLFQTFFYYLSISDIAKILTIKYFTLIFKKSGKNTKWIISHLPNTFVLATFFQFSTSVHWDHVSELDMNKKQKWKII